MRIAVLEPYYGGSHAAFLDLFIECTRHSCTLLTLPARKWKWRMRGAAVWFTRRALANISEQVDVLFTSDMLSVADLRALLPGGLRNVVIVVYFHENQLTYPLPPHDFRDFQFGMTNITSCLAADAVWFNSRFHLEAFLSAAEALMRKMPDHIPSGVIDEIRGKSAVLPPAVRVDLPASAFADAESGAGTRSDSTKGKVRILWCHRWEFDKNPEPFFDALIRLDQAGYEFELVLVGEQFRTAPTVFAKSWDRLSRRIAHAGYIENRHDYLRMLSTCDVVVSSAIQENFGIAVIEAVQCGCQPLLPNRLAYPEVIPAGFHERCLYARDTDLFGRLASFLDGPGRLTQPEMEQLIDVLKERYSPESRTAALDEAFEQVFQRWTESGPRIHRPR